MVRCIPIVTGVLLVRPLSHTLTFWNKKQGNWGVYSQVSTSKVRTPQHSFELQQWWQARCPHRHTHRCILSRLRIGRRPFQSTECIRRVTRGIVITTKQYCNNLVHQKSGHPYILTPASQLRYVKREQTNYTEWSSVILSQLLKILGSLIHLLSSPISLPRCHFHWSVVLGFPWFQRLPAFAQRIPCWLVPCWRQKWRLAGCFHVRVLGTCVYTFNLT